MLSLADAILQEDINSVRQLVSYGEEINQLDEYGFTPLIEAAIVENINRADLNPIEAAKAFQRLIDEFGYLHGGIVQENAGKLMGKMTP
jgi:ankyrin repeat protein